MSSRFAGSGADTDDTDIAYSQEAFDPQNPCFLCEISVRFFEVTEYMKKRHSAFSELKNFGPTSEKWLNAIGVFTKSELVRLGSIHAYRLMKERGFNVTLNLLYAMEGTILGVPWNQIPERLKAELQVGVSKVRKP